VRLAWLLISYGKRAWYIGEQRSFGVCRQVDDVNA
jgi:hypothetical protein